MKLVLSFMMSLIEDSRYPIFKNECFLAALTAVFFPTPKDAQTVSHPDKACVAKILGMKSACFFSQ